MRQSQALILRIVFTIIVLLYIAEAYPYFADRIPNGKRIPHPCKPNFMWYGVGHVNYKGGGERNEFGKAFARQEYQWTVCLCKEDSDGDGKTNGEELGDPDCVWSVGKIPDVSKGITHPGICDPFNGAECSGKNDWVDCSDEPEAKCDALNEPDVKSITIQFDKTKVPDKETTYYCQSFNLTSKLPKGESHLIGSRIKLDNKNVMHHATVYACDDSNAKEAITKFSSPVDCGMQMATELCQTILAIWTLGVDVNCYHENTGFSVGADGFKTVIMEFHWNNPELRDDYTDASGISLFVTTNKRPYDAGVWSIAPPIVYIPPGYQRYVNHGGCSSACTDLMMDQSIYITNLLPHMHYLGTAFVFQQYRNGIKIYELLVDRYMYDSPHVEDFSPPLEVKPGDELRIQCVYQTVARKRFTFFDYSTQEEMCVGIMTYYPYLETLDQCLTNKGYGYCNKTIYPDPFDANGANLCNATDFYITLHQDTEAIERECDINGFECFQNCKRAISRVVGHPCMNGPARDVIRINYAYNKQGTSLLSRLGSCEERPPIDGGSGVDVDSNVCDLTPPTSNVQIVNQSFRFLVVWVFMVLVSFIN